MSTPAAPTDMSLLALAKEAVAGRSKPGAKAHLSAIDPALLGAHWHPARLPLRAAEAAVDIGRWDLAAARLDDVTALLSESVASPS